MPKPKLALGNLQQRANEEFVADKSYEKAVSQNLKLLPFEEIADRPGGNTRPLNEIHIHELAESIAVIGLITPLTVDRHGCLLAGAHRRAAIHKLKHENPTLYDEFFPEGIPVRIVDIDAMESTSEALLIEIEENTQRRDFTAKEVKEAAIKLKNAGYIVPAGRPKKGQKLLKRELAKVFRLSEDRIQKILNDSFSKGRRTPSFSPEVAIETLEKWQRQLEKANLDDAKKVQSRVKSLLRELKKYSEGTLLK